MRWAAVVFVCALCAPGAARAFCGFYVGGADAQLFNNASVVVLMRNGTRTVVSMQNDYQGPARDFAMVVPVPTVLQRDQVRTLPRDVFDRVDQMAAPRLVEYWEQDPCNQTIGLGSLGMIGRGAGGGSGSGYGSGAGSFGVRVEAQFAVGEYDIVILSARDSTGLDGWLRANDYRIPEGAAEVLRPYVQSGSKFFVAKVDVRRVRYVNGHAALSPLRFHYDSDTFSLPIRLGLLSSSGTQDLIVHVFADSRYELANRPNVFIPTNIDVAPDARERFGAFYAALFDRTVQRNPGAAITEYSWAASTCDPCPGPQLDASVLATLGADVAYGAVTPQQRPVVPQAPTIRADPPTAALSAEVLRRVVRRHTNEIRFCGERFSPGSVGQQQVVLEMSIGPDGAVTASAASGATIPGPAFARCAEQAARRWTFPAPPEGGRVVATYPMTFWMGAGASGVGGMVLTRMHLRYGRDDVGEDLVFRAAPAVIGGREVRGTDGRLEETAREAMTNNFQGRYAIRHPWTGPIACANPVRGVWGGNPAARGDGFGGGAGIGSGSGVNTTSATGLGLVARGGVDLNAILRQSVPELGITIADSLAAPGAAQAQSPPRADSPGNSPGHSPGNSPGHSPGNSPGHSPRNSSGSPADARVHPVGCSSATGDHGRVGWVAMVIAGLALFARRRRAC